MRSILSHINLPKPLNSNENSSFSYWCFLTDFNASQVQITENLIARRTIGEDKPKKMKLLKRGENYVQYYFQGTPQEDEYSPNDPILSSKIANCRDFDTGRTISTPSSSNNITRGNRSHQSKILTPPGCQIIEFSDDAQLLNQMSLKSSHRNNQPDPLMSSAPYESSTLGFNGSKLGFIIHRNCDGHGCVCKKMMATFLCLSSGINVYQHSGNNSQHVQSPQQSEGSSKSDTKCQRKALGSLIPLLLSLLDECPPATQSPICCVFSDMDQIIMLQCWLPSQIIVTVSGQLNCPSCSSSMQALPQTMQCSSILQSDYQIKFLQTTSSNAPGSQNNGLVHILTRWMQGDDPLRVSLELINGMKEGDFQSSNGASLNNGGNFSVNQDNCPPISTKTTAVILIRNEKNSSLSIMNYHELLYRNLSSITPSTFGIVKHAKNVSPASSWTSSNSDHGIIPARLPVSSTDDISSKSASVPHEAEGSAGLQSTGVGNTTTKSATNKTSTATNFVNVVAVTPLTKPKGYISAFNFYCSDIRTTVVAENPKLKNNEINRILGERWKSLDTQSRKPFEDLAVQDKLRYLKEINQLNSSQYPIKIVPRINAPEGFTLSGSKIDNSIGDNNTQSRRKRTKSTRSSSEDGTSDSNTDSENGHKKTSRGNTKIFPTSSTSSIARQQQECSTIEATSGLDRFCSSYNQFAKQEKHFMFGVLGNGMCMGKHFGHRWKVMSDDEKQCYVALETASQNNPLTNGLYNGGVMVVNSVNTAAPSGSASSTACSKVHTNNSSESLSSQQVNQVPIDIDSQSPQHVDQQRYPSPTSTGHNDNHENERKARLSTDKVIARPTPAVITPENSNIVNSKVYLNNDVCHRSGLCDSESSCENQTIADSLHKKVIVGMSYEDDDYIVKCDNYHLQQQLLYQGSKKSFDIWENIDSKSGDSNMIHIVSPYKRLRMSSVDSHHHSMAMVSCEEEC